MKSMHQNLSDWLLQKAHVITGRPFQLGDCSCVPVAPETQREEEAPVGFLVTRGAEVAYVAAQTPDGREMTTAWAKSRWPEIPKEEHALPAEYWYG